MPINAKPSGHHSYVPPPDFIAEARSHATAGATTDRITTIAYAEAVETDLASYLDLYLTADEDHAWRTSLWFHNREAPSAVWRDLFVIDQLQNISGQPSRSFAELAAQLIGLRFLATLVYDRRALTNLDMRDIVAAAPVPEAADAPIL